MTGLLSRLVVAAAALPVVLGLVYLGGWWMFALAGVAVLLGLHEYYGLTRPLRPVVLAGYAGATATILGAQGGGVEWALAGFLSTFALAFVLKGVSNTSQPATVSVGATVLGVGWIGLGVAHVILIRDIPEDGRLAAFTLLLAVFAADTAAYFVGRIFGRHKLAPSVSPGKTWEGFVAGSAACIFVTWVSLYDTGYVEGWRSLVLGGAIAIAAPIGDLFASSLKRDMQAKDFSRILGGHGGILDRLDAVLFSAIAAYYVLAAYGAT
jgi:phosphatidate cytidylyltransferase